MCSIKEEEKNIENKDNNVNLNPEENFSDCNITHTSPTKSYEKDPSLNNTTIINNLNNNNIIFLNLEEEG